MRSTIRAAVASVLVATAWLAGGTAGAYEAPERLRWLSSGEVVEGSRQKVSATGGAAHVEVSTTGLDRGHAYTLWVAFFNHPEHCVDGRVPGLRCGPADVANPLVDASVVWGDGLVSSGRRDRFGGRIDAGAKPGAAQTAMGRGILTNPEGAEYHFVVRDHGPADRRYPDQTTSFEGGCRAGDDNICRDVQATGFRTQFPFTLI